MENLMMDRLAILTLSGTQSGKLMAALTRENFHFTVVDSSGGLVQEPVVCLLVGFQHERMSVLLSLLREYCRPYKQYVPTQGLLQDELAGLSVVEAQLGGALVYMMNVERFIQL